MSSGDRLHGMVAQPKSPLKNIAEMQACATEYLTFVDQYNHSMAARSLLWLRQAPFGLQLRLLFSPQIAVTLICWSVLQRYAFYAFLSLLFMGVGSVSGFIAGQSILSSVLAFTLVHCLFEGFKVQPFIYKDVNDQDVVVYARGSWQQVWLLAKTFFKSLFAGVALTICGNLLVDWLWPTLINSIAALVGVFYHESPRLPSSAHAGALPVHIESGSVVEGALDAVLHYLHHQKNVDDIITASLNSSLQST